MNYAEKTQLFTGLIILASVSTSYFYFSFYYKKLNVRWLLPFLHRLLIGLLFIGFHQIFEFLSLTTNNAIVYKVGLMISIIGMLFFALSLEKLYNRNLHIKLFIIPLVLVAVYLSIKSISFGTINFHLSHNSISAWMFVWFILFMYWNICALFERKNVNPFISKFLVITYLLASMVDSFLLSLGYAFYNHYAHNLNMCTTASSIWCTFSVVHIIFLPIFLHFLPRRIKKLPPETTMPLKSFFLYILLALLIFSLLATYLGRTGCFNMTFLLN